MPYKCELCNFKQIKPHFWWTRFSEMHKKKYLRSILKMILLKKVRLLFRRNRHYYP